MLSVLAGRSRRKTTYILLRNNLRQTNKHTYTYNPPAPAPLYSTDPLHPPVKMKIKPPSLKLKNLLPLPTYLPTCLNPSHTTTFLCGASQSLIPALILFHPIPTPPKSNNNHKKTCCSIHQLMRYYGTQMFLQGSLCTIMDIFWIISFFEFYML